MVSTFTPNVNIEEPARGDDVGTWDSPVNNNSTLLDLILGGISAIPLAGANVTLNAGQFSCAQITFSSTLLANVAITFPTSFKKPYTINNTTTGSSQFTISLGTTAAGGQVISCPPGQSFDIINDGANIKFKNFGPPVGGFWDYAGSSTPTWVSSCTVPPYLNCDGGPVSSATYPALFSLIGATLPDLRGRVRAYLNQGTGRMISSASSAGVDGNTNFASGGAQATALTSFHLPQLIDPGHSHTLAVAFNLNSAQLNADGSPFHTNAGTTATSTVATGITYGSSAQINVPAMQPTAVAGLTLIRSA